MSIESVMPSNHLILCCPLLLPPLIFPSIGVFSNESVLCNTWPKDWSFSFSISPSNEYSGLISFRMGWLDLLAVQRILRVFPTLEFKNTNSLVLSFLYSATLSFTISRSLLKLMSIKLVSPFNHLVLYSPLLLLPSIFPSIRVFSNEPAFLIRWPKYQSFSFSISPSNVYSDFRIYWLDLLAVQGNSQKGFSFLD